MGKTELSIKQNMLWNSFGSLVNLGCQWLMTVIVVRLANGYEAAGVFSLAVSVYGIFGVVAQYRMYTYQVSDVQNENAVGEYLAFRLVTNAASLVLCMLYAVVTCAPDTWFAIFLYGLYRAVALMVDVFHACDQRHHRMDLIGQSLALQGIISLIMFIVVFYVTGNLELSIAVMAIAAAVVGLAFDFPRTRRLEKISFGISRQKAVYLVVTCFPIVIAGVIASATPTVPRQYLALAMGADALGVYASVAAPVAIIQMGASYVYNPLLGYFSERFFKKDRKGFVSLFLKSAALIALIGVVCSLLLAVLGESLLVFVFGESIRPFAYLLLPLVGLAVLTGYLWFLNDLLISFRNFKGTFIGCIVSFAVALVIMVPMVSTFGMNGVTFAGLVSTLAGIVAMGVALHAQLRRWFE